MIPDVTAYLPRDLEDEQAEFYWYEMQDRYEELQDYGTINERERNTDISEMIPSFSSIVLPYSTRVELHTGCMRLSVSNQFISDESGLPYITQLISTFEDLSVHHTYVEPENRLKTVDREGIIELVWQDNTSVNLNANISDASLFYEILAKLKQIRQAITIKLERIDIGI